jgi:hypothetical protein
MYGSRSIITLTVSLLVGCSGPVKYPEGSFSVQCTNLVSDCGQQIAEKCPTGYKVVHEENWSTHLAPMARGGGRAPPVRHTSLRIMCDPVSEVPRDSEASPGG